MFGDVKPGKTYIEGLPMLRRRRGYTLLEMSAVCTMASTLMAIVLFWFGTTYDFRSEQRQHRDSIQVRWALSERIEEDLWQADDLRLEKNGLVINVKDRSIVYSSLGSLVERREGSSYESFKVVADEGRVEVELVNGLGQVNCLRDGRLLWRKTFGLRQHNRQASQPSEES